MTGRGTHPHSVSATDLRDRVLLASCIVLICALAWAYLVHLGATMSSPSAASMHDMGMRMDAPWRAADVLLTFTMWAVMMVGMMGPSAMPMLLLFAATRARAKQRGTPTIVLPFALGYLTVWLGFSAGATLLHWMLDGVGLLSSSMAVTSPRVAGALLVLAGIYQLTPAKNACLKHCRSPMDFLMSHWREGRIGALRMGLRHGIYCLGCCWALMGILFALGVMNLAVVGVLTAFILLERFGHIGARVSHAGGVAMILVGVFLVVV